MIAFKLFRLRKNGTLGSLFINRKAIIPIGKWLLAENYPTKGYKVRPGWHSTSNPEAPHLSMRGRIWMKVEIMDYKKLMRPKNQGGLWYLSKWIRVLEKV